MARAHGDVEVVGWGHMWSAWLANFTGDPDAAIAHAQTTLEIAERIGDAFSRAYAWLWVGLAATLRGEWPRAKEAVQTSMTLARERRTAMEAEGFRLAVLADAHRGLGELDEALRLAREGMDAAGTQQMPLNECLAILSFARAAFASGSPSVEGEAATALERGLELVERSEGRAFEPLLRVELAELARRRGDDEGRGRELREAERLFTEFGASGHAAGLAGELEALPS
jgi:tetratricopeptide (TPR) repeat protein